eukprot:gene5554-6738_t
MAVQGDDRKGPGSMRKYASNFRLSFEEIRLHQSTARDARRGYLNQTMINAPLRATTGFERGAANDALEKAAWEMSHSPEDATLEYMSAIQDFMAPAIHENERLRRDKSMG